MQPVEQKPRSPLLRVTQAAARLSVSRSFAYQLMDTGQLPYVKIGKSRRVPAEAVEKLIEECTVANH